MVFSGFVTLCRLAGCPTRTSPLSVHATMDGVVRAPSAFSITLSRPPSMTATQELVVPRSMPMALLMTILRDLPLVVQDGDVLRWGRGEGQKHVPSAAALADATRRP